MRNAPAMYARFYVRPLGRVSPVCAIGRHDCLVSYKSTGNASLHDVWLENDATVDATIGALLNAASGSQPKVTRRTTEELQTAYKIACRDTEERTNRQLESTN